MSYTIEKPLPDHKLWVVYDESMNVMGFFNSHYDAETWVNMAGRGDSLCLNIML